MTKYNKRGEEVVDTKLDAADKRDGRDVIYTASDQEADSQTLLLKILVELRQIKLHLAKMSNENITEKDAK